MGDFPTQNSENGREWSDATTQAHAAARADASSKDAWALDACWSDDAIAPLARLSMNGIEREYPNKPAHVMTGPESIVAPRTLHPVFFGCFDWHSAVHGHWTLVRLLRRFPASSVAVEIRTTLERQFAADKLAVEAAYFDVAENHSFERTYGWAWLLRLAAELQTWDDPHAKRWAVWLAPLEMRIVALMRSYLPKLHYPVRSGVHSDTAFALGQMHDYAALTDNATFAREIAAYCRDKYAKDRAYAPFWEPSGEDFFSPALNEADVMRRVLSGEEFAAWLDDFLPGLADSGSPTARLLRPVDRFDVADGRLVHLAGLNFSRAWALTGIAGALPSGDARQALLAESIAAHAKVGMQSVFSGDYAGEHWLATFAVYLFTSSHVLP